MGYKRNPKVYRLQVEDEYDGLEVMVRSLSMGQLIGWKTGDREKDVTEEMVELLAERIVEWNLEDENGHPVPPTLENIKEEDNDLVFAIINHWTDAVRGVDTPLPESSPSGEQSPALSIPMEPLSESRAS